MPQIEINYIYKKKKQVVLLIKIQNFGFWTWVSGFIGFSGIQDLCHFTSKNTIINIKLCVVSIR